jgi:hypothetical protein
MWKANGKTTTLFFPGWYLSKKEKNARCFLWRQNMLKVNYSPI